MPHTAALCARVYERVASTTFGRALRLLAPTTKKTLSQRLPCAHVCWMAEILHAITCTLGLVCGPESVFDASHMRTRWIPAGRRSQGAKLKQAFYDRGQELNLLSPLYSLDFSKHSECSVCREIVAFCCQH